VSLSQAVIAIKAASREVLPASVSASFQGTAQAFESSIGGLWALLVISIAVIYIVLGILYESFVHPLTILSGLPSAGFGALLTLRMFGCELNVYGFRGPNPPHRNREEKRHHANRLRAPIAARAWKEPDGRDPRSVPDPLPAHPHDDTGGAARGASHRDRLWSGRRRAPTARLAVVGGLVFSQLVTLYLTPVYYYYFEHTVEMFRAWRHRRAALAPAAHI
jgi:HAE1 family hydrophobic/amphiphilic exporter-1